MKTITSSLVLCAVLAASGAAQASLIDRGGGLIYDTDLNITWLSNANLAFTETFGLARNVNLGTDSYGYQSVIYNDGRMTWGYAKKWIAAMNTNNYQGYNDWRLPTTLQPDASCGYQSGSVSYGLNCTGSEMGHLFYNELGGVAAQSIITTHNANYSLFQNVQSHLYWSGTEYAPLTSEAWGFHTNDGYQGANTNDYGMFAMAVRPGQVAAVPVPAAAWLLGSGLLGLIGVARRKVTN